MSYAVSAAAVTNSSRSSSQQKQTASIYSQSQQQLPQPAGNSSSSSSSGCSKQQLQHLQQPAATAAAATAAVPKRVPFQHFLGFFRDVGEGAEEVLVEEGAAVDLAVGAEEDLEGIQPAAGQRHQLACNNNASTENLSSQLMGI